MAVVNVSKLGIDCRPNSVTHRAVACDDGFQEFGIAAELRKKSEKKSGTKGKF